MDSTLDLLRRIGLVFLAAVWLTAAVAKLRAATLFSQQAAALHLPSWLNPEIFPMAEIALVALMLAVALSGRYLRPMALLNAVLFLTMLVFLVWDKTHGLGKLGCGCFGVREAGISTWDLVRDGLLTALSILVALGRRAGRSLSGGV